jgi:soluble lytic murein transglycosylase-like protein
MPSRVAIFASITLTILGLSARPARAQIAFYTDSDGRRIYINGNDPSAPKTPAKRPAATSNAAATPAAAPAGSAATSSPSGNTTDTSATDQPATAPDASNDSTPAKPTLDQMVHDVATKYNVDPELIRAVIGTESNWNPHAVSRTGAQGLMQLVPSTARDLGVRNAFDPQQNLDGGVRYLRMLLERYNGDLDKALAAYNAGPGAVDRAGGVPHIAETQNYVQHVTAAYNHPDSVRSPRGVVEASHPIYRSVDDSGRVVFTNE